MTNSKSNKILFAIYEWTESILFSLCIVLLAFTFLIKTYMVDGTSMYPTLSDGERVFAHSVFNTPKQGDIVIIDANNSINEPIVKRVIATGGQVVDISQNSGLITVDGIEIDNPIGTSTDNINGDVVFPQTVPEGYIFVMGDNRSSSLDSRFSRLGFIDERSVLGKKI